MIFSEPPRPNEAVKKETLWKDHGSRFGHRAQEVVHMLTQSGQGKCCNSCVVVDLFLDRDEH